MSVIHSEMLEELTDFTGLCYFLTSEERLRLFDMLCDVVQKRIPERVSMALGIQRTNVYPYMKGRKRRHIPDAENTGKIIKALRDNGCNTAILPILEPAIERMRKSSKIYQKWLERTKRLSSPVSKAEIERLEWSMNRDGMYH